MNVRRRDRKQEVADQRYLAASISDPDNPVVVYDSKPVFDAALRRPKTRRKR